MADNVTSKLPKHRIIEMDLLSDIKSGQLAVGQQLATGNEVSLKYGVSVLTAEKAIGSLAGKGYLERTPGRGTFVKDWRHVENYNLQANSIVLVCTSGQLAFYSRFMNEACLEAESHGFSLVYSVMEDSDECAVPLAIRTQQAAGSLIIGRATERQVAALAKEKTPHVFLGSHRYASGHASVCHDVEDGAYQITKKLLELDQGPVWLVTQPPVDVYYSQELQDGYHRAVFESGDQVSNVHFARREDNEADYERLVQRMIATGQEHFPMIVNYSHGGRLMEHFKRNKIDFERTSIVIVGRPNTDWLYRDRLIEWNFSLTTLAREAVRQIIVAAEDGSAIAGKRYKLRLEMVDDPVKLFTYSWE